MLLSALSLSCTTGCDEKNVLKETSESGYYHGQEVSLRRLEFINGTRKEEVTQRTVTATKYFDKDGRLVSVEWHYRDGTNDSKTYTTPIEDPIPGLLPGIRLIDHVSATSSSTGLTPFTSGISDNTQANDTTPELPVEGEHSHVEGGV